MEVALLRHFVPAPEYIPNPTPKMAIDRARLFQPSRILYLRAGSGRTHSETIDMTMYLLPSYQELLNADFHDSIYHTIRTNPDLRPTWLATREHRLRPSDITVKEIIPYGGENKVAKIHPPVLAFGTAMISFSPGSLHCTHKLIVYPISSKTRAQSFLKDGVYYVWDTTETVTRAERTSGRLSLYKAGSVKKIEVARYLSLSGKFEVGGVLLVEEGELDALVAVLTVLGTLGQKDQPGVPKG